MIKDLHLDSGADAHATRITVSETNAPDRIVVGDAQFLLSAKYTKAGSDLILTDADGHKVVLAGYFASTKHPDLMASGGALLSAKIVEQLAGPEHPGQYAQAGSPAGAAVIGKVERLGGAATVQHANGVTQELHVGDAILQGDVVETGDGSQLGMSFVDGTAFNMGPDARMAMSELVYSAGSNSNAAVFSMLKGTIAFVAGQVAKTGDMRVETPVGTMGIRGTYVIAQQTVNLGANSWTFSLSADPDGHVGHFDVTDPNGVVIANLTTTDTVVTVTPTANLNYLAQITQKTPEIIQQDIFFAQILFPIYLSNPANFANPPQPQDLQPRAPGAPGSGTPPDLLQDDQHQTQNIHEIITVTTTHDDGHGGTTTGSATGIFDIPIPSSGQPLINISTSPHAVVEATQGDPGVPTAVEDVTKSDPFGGTVSYDTAALANAGWTSLGGGKFSKDGQYGTATLDTNANTVTYVLDNVKADPLQQGETVTDPFTIPVIEGTTQASADAVFTVEGRNDAAVITGATGGAVLEAGSNNNDGVPATTGTLVSQDVDNPPTFQAVASPTASDHGYGTFTMTADGVWIYTLDNSNPAVNALSNGDHLTDTFTVRSADGTAQVVTVDIAGANDAPVVLGTSTVSGEIHAVTAPVPGGGGTGTPETATAAAYLLAGHDLINGLGGSAGFGENVVAVGDDNSTGAIDITSVFGAQGLNFFGHDYTTLFINNNGNITFASPSGTFTPSQITAGAGNPIIAPFWADVDTRGGAGVPTPGGTSTGSNHVYYDLDSTNGVFTVTWDDVGYYGAHTDKLDAFQLQLISLSNGNFDIVFRYENINWTTGDASGGFSGLGGTPARAGYAAGDGVNFFELPQSGNQTQILSLPGDPGVEIFSVVNGTVVTGGLEASGQILFTDPENDDTHTISDVQFTGSGQALGQLTFVKNNDTDAPSHIGSFGWTYTVAPTALSSLAFGETRVETFLVTISDGQGGFTQQTISIDLVGSNHSPVAAPVTLAAIAEDSGPRLITQAELLSHASDVDGQSLTAINLAISSGNGTLTDNGNGTWTYHPAANDDTGVTFSYQVTDGIAAPVTASASLDITPVDDPPTAGSASATVSEEGLPNGVPDSIGAPDTTNSATASGTIAVSDVDSNSLSVAFGDPGAVLTSGGHQVTWSGVGTHTLVGSAGGNTVISLTINDAGGYTVNLLGPVDHPVAGVEDSLSLVVPISVSDGQLTTPTTLTVNIEDDSPIANPSHLDVPEPAGGDTNVLLMIDISGSMTDPSGLTGLTRIDLLKASVDELLEQYHGQGDTAVRIVTFSDTASALGSGWLTIDQAKALIDGLDPFGATNYDAALAAGMTAFSTSGKIAGAQNVAYFLSDGLPNVGDNSIGIVNLPGDPEVTNWQDFLHANGIDSFAIGIGSGVSVSALDPIAYDGRGNGVDTNGIVVTDPSQLISTLVGTIPAPVSSNILANGAPNNSFGADGGHVQSITFGGITYTYHPDAVNPTMTDSDGGALDNATFSAATHVLTISNSSGTFAVNMDTAAYSYSTPPSVSADTTFSYGYTLVDGDGDTASNTLSITVHNVDKPPLVRDDHIITNAAGNPTFNIPDAALLFNDTDPDGQPITVTGISNVVGGSASHNNGVTTYTQVNPFGAGITYTGTSNGLSDTGHITFDRAQVGQSQLDGTDLGEILIGRDNASDTLVGYHGNDVLIGGTGNDTFIFRVGDGKDMVTDFQHASDTIEFDNVNFSTFTDLQSLFHQQGTDLLIAYTATDSVLLKGVSGVSLTASDFVIHHA